jgi:transcriptional regulator with XRE-family HTH domain
MINPKLIKIHDQIERGVAPLKAIREALELNQAEFAVMLGVAVSTVSRWETGQSPVTLKIDQVKKLELLLKELGLTFQNLPDWMGPPENLHSN